MSKRFWVDTIERVISAGLEAFLAVWLVYGSVSQSDTVFEWKHVKLALVAAAIGAGKCILASLKGNADSASLAQGI